MNVREEDKRKTSNTTRGLATAAIGLGIGAALYYFLSKGSTHPDSEGATSSGWTHERVFRLEVPGNDSDSYSTISEGTTSDTSVHDDTFEYSISTSLESDDESNYSSTENTSETSNTSKSDVESDTSISTEHDTDLESQSEDSHSMYEYSLTDSANDIQSDDDSDTESDYAETDMSVQSEEEAMDEIDISNLMYNDGLNRESLETGYTSMNNMGNSEYDSETAMEWDITNTSLGIPSDERSSSLSNFFGGLTRLISPRKTRERSWTLEECSICFDVMLRDQEIMTLSCTHNFHAQCIMPWLQEKQTCPNCRKQAE